MSKILHNPKSHAPAIHIPCWLSQVPIKLLSHGAKMLYGRLSQWANENGRVYRSSKQLSEEIGTSIDSIDNYIRELKDVELIGTYHPQAGGVNHFIFYVHPWMHEPINKHLVYKSSTEDPPEDSPVPSRGFSGTPPENPTDINKKEIKEIKPINTPIGVDNFKNLFLSLENLTADNPHCIDESQLTEWLLIRKKKKSPLTKTAWDRTNKVLFRLVAAGLNAHDCFERMVASGWQGMEYKYFEQELRQPTNKYPTPDERAANEVKIREREFKAQEEKQREIEGSHKAKHVLDALKSSMTFLEAKKKADEEMHLLGMTAREYHNHLLRNNRAQCHV